MSTSVARPSSKRAIAVSRETGRLWWVAWNMHHLGASAREHAELELAARTLEEGEAILTQLGESHAHSHLIAFLGAVLFEQGELDRGQQLIEQSLAESRAINCEDGAAVALYLLAGLTRLRGDAVLATRRAIEGLVLQHRQSNDALGARLAACVELLGGLACDAGAAGTHRQVVWSRRHRAQQLWRADAAHPASCL